MRLTETLRRPMPECSAVQLYYCMSSPGRSIGGARGSDLLCLRQELDSNTAAIVGVFVVAGLLLCRGGSACTCFFLPER